MDIRLASKKGPLANTHDTLLFIGCHYKLLLVRERDSAGPPFFFRFRFSSSSCCVHYSIPLAHHRVFYMRTMVAMCCCYCCCVLSWPLFISWLGATPRLGYIRISETRPSDQPAALLIFIRALHVLCCVVNDLPLLHTLHGQQQLYYSTDNQKKNFLIPLLAECCCCRVLGRIIPSALEG